MLGWCFDALNNSTATTTTKVKIITVPIKWTEENVLRRLSLRGALVKTSNVLFFLYACRIAVIHSSGSLIYVQWPESTAILQVFTYLWSPRNSIVLIILHFFFCFFTKLIYEKHLICISSFMRNIELRASRSRIDNKFYFIWSVKFECIQSRNQYFAIYLHFNVSFILNRRHQHKIRQIL